MWVTARRLLLRYDLYPKWRYRQAQERELANWNGQPPLPAILKQRLVRSFLARHHLRVLVETGTFYAAMVDACLDCCDRIFTIELQDDLSRRAQRRFRAFPQVTVLHGDSAERIEDVLAQLSGPALFWLDAHYSEGITARAKKDTPVLAELEQILNHPTMAKGHIILIDDARGFDGTRDYPTLTAVEQMAVEHGLRFHVADDVIRMIPAVPG